MTPAAVIFASNGVREKKLRKNKYLEKWKIIIIIFCHFRHQQPFMRSCAADSSPPPHSLRLLPAHRTTSNVTPVVVFVVVVVVCDYPPHHFGIFAFNLLYTFLGSREIATRFISGCFAICFASCASPLNSSPLLLFKLIVFQLSGGAKWMKNESQAMRM